MARGQRKSIDEKIREKEELIGALKVRIQSEERELNDLITEKRNKEAEAITRMLAEAGISMEEAKDLIAQHVADLKTIGTDRENRSGKTKQKRKQNRKQKR